MIAAFKDHKRYPVKEIRKKLVIRTEQGDFIISKYEVSCHQCGKPLGYKVTKNEKPGFYEVSWHSNFFIPYFWTLNGDCIAALHGGFSRPAEKLEDKDRQTLIEEWCE